MEMLNLGSQAQRSVELTHSGIVLRLGIGWSGAFREAKNGVVVGGGGDD